MAAFRETETKFIIEFKFVMDGSTVKSVDLSRRNMPGPMQQNGISKEAWNIFIEELDELAKKHPLVGKNKDSRASTAVYWTLVAVVGISCCEHPDILRMDWNGKLNEALGRVSMGFTGVLATIVEDTDANRVAVSLEICYKAA